MRPPVDFIEAPPFPSSACWLNSEPLKMHELEGRPVLIEFFDFCRFNSLHTLPYVKAWHERYAADGLLVISVHSPGFRPGANEAAATAAVERLAIAHPVLLDSAFGLWHEYENEGWPARYLWNAGGKLDYLHYGEGAYAETELAIQKLLGVTRAPLAPLRAEDAPGATLAAPSEDRLEPPFDGPYEAGAVWAVVEGAGTIVVNGIEQTISHTGAHELIAHPRHAAGELELSCGEGVRCYAVCFGASFAVGAGLAA